MKGRLEHDLQNEQKIRVILSRMPDFIAEWDQNLKACGKTAVTRINYLYKVGLYLKYISEDTLNIGFSDLTFISAQGFFVSMQHIRKKGELVESSDSYKCLVYNALRSMFLYFVKRGYMAVNPMDMIDCPENHDRERIRERRRLLTANDFKKILRAVEDDNSVLRNRNMAIMLIFMTTGMRKTALTEINVEDIDLRNGTLSVMDKRKKTHVYYLGKSAVDAVRGWKEERVGFLCGGSSDALFIHPGGERVGVYTINYIVAKYTKRALGRALSAHKLRGGYINILYSKKPDLRFVCSAVGHSSVTTTALYLDAKGNERRKARDLMERALVE